MAQTIVAYVSSTYLGVEMFQFLKKQDCKIIHANTYNDPVDWESLPPYHLGINFLGTHKVPESQFQSYTRWVNFHPGPLPEFGGRNLSYHAIMREAEMFGATLHYMDKDYDTGEIIEVQRFPVLPSDNAGDLIAKSNECLAKMFHAWIPRLIESRGKVPSFPQDKAKARYYKKLPINQELEMGAGNEKLIRALTVHPRFHARITIGGKKYKIIPENM